MPNVTLSTGCKVNLTLKITGITNNGYHTLSSLFWPIHNPHDTLTISDGKPGTGLTVRCERPDIDIGRNTLTKAYDAFAAATGFAPDINLALNKHIPSGAGLGGGSADAGIFLRYLNGIAPKQPDAETLRRICTSVGADVFFFLQDAPCLAEGVGDILTPRPDLKAAMRGRSFLIVCPDIFISTPWAYEQWDQYCLTNHDLTKSDSTDTQEISCLDSSFSAGLPFCPKNDFESVVFAVYPILAELKERILRYGACAAVMSGSGSSLCGIFAENDAHKCAEAAEHFHQAGIAAYTCAAV